MPRSWPALLTLLVAAGSAAAPETFSVDYFTHPSDLGRMQISPDGKFLAATFEADGANHLTFIDLAHPSDVKDMMAPEGTAFLDFQWISPVRVLYRLGVRQPGLQRAVTTGELLAIDRDGTKPQYVYGCRYVNSGRDSGFKLSTHLSAEPAPETPPPAPAGDGAEKPGLHMSCGTAEVLSTLAKDDRKILVAEHAWQDDNGAYRYDPDAAPTVALIDTYDGSEQIVEQISLRGAKVLVDRDDRPRFASGRDGTNNLTVTWRPQPDAPWQSFALPDFVAKDFAPAMLTPDGNAAFFVGRRTHDSRKALYRLDLRSHAAEKIYEHVSMDVDGAVKDIAGEQVIGARVEAELPEYHWIDESDASVKLYQTMQRAFPKQWVEITSVSDDRRQAILLVQSDVNPGDYYLLDTQSRKAQYLRSARAWVDPAKMRHKESLWLKARDGLLLRGYLTRPSDGPGPFPVVVLPHRVPHGERDTWRYDWEAQLFAHYGYAVLQVNYRGSGGYGEDFERAGYREWGGKMQDDLTDATRWLIGQGIAAKDNICIFGSAYGGYAALMGVVREPGLYECAAAYDGFYDLELVLARDDPTVTPAARKYLDEILGTDVQSLRARSPVHNARRIEDAVLIVAANTGERVENQHAVSMWSAMQAAGKPVETAVFERPVDVYPRVLVFLAQHLHGGRLPPALPEAAPPPAAPSP